MSILIVTINEIILHIYTYVGAAEIVLGTIGNILTLLIYTQRPLCSTRAAPYIIILAVLNTIFLDSNTIPRLIVSIWRQTDTTFGIEIVCPLRTAGLWTCLTIIMLTLPWLALDRYLCSCRQVSRRQLSTAKLLRNGLIGILGFAVVTNFPYIFYVRLRFEPTLRILSCAITDPHLVRFHAYFQTLLIFTMLPLILLAVFGFLTVRNIRTVKQTSNRFERQVTRVLTSQVILDTFALLPYCLYILYSNISANEPKAVLHRTIEHLAFVIILHIYYLLFCSHFYISLIISKEVRAAVRSLMYLPTRRRNQVLPHTQSLGSLRTIKKKSSEKTVSYRKNPHGALATSTVHHQDSFDLSTEASGKGLSYIRRVHSGNVSHRHKVYIRAEHRAGRAVCPAVLQDGLFRAAGRTDEPSRPAFQYELYMHKF